MFPSRRRYTRGVIFSLFVAILGHILVSTAVAGPILQLYVEGGSYDSATESWDVSADSTIRLWAIGNVAGPGGAGTIYDVRLAVAYDAAAGSPVVSLTPSTTGGYGGFLDPSVADPATFVQTVTNGSRPLLGDGRSLPGHGIYGPGTHWQEFLLGDFTGTDSQIEDFIDAFPIPDATTEGQISVYEVTVSGSLTEPLSLHFDLYDHVAARNRIRAVFAPFSHDADGSLGDIAVVPEAESMIAWLLCGLAFCAFRVYSRRRALAPAH
jgi:hypothetical protein